MVELPEFSTRPLFTGGGGDEEGVVATERHQRGSLRKNAFLLSGMPIASMGSGGCERGGQRAPRAERTEEVDPPRAALLSTRRRRRRRGRGRREEERKIRDGIPSVYRCISVTVPFNAIAIPRAVRN